MTILYVSHLANKVASGLSWSVPASVKAQEALDNVLWLNTTKEEMPHWKAIKAYTKSPRVKSLNILKSPFNHPDMVVFEGFYDDLYDVVLGRWLRRENIPYVIIPRSALTIQAMNNHSKIKKRIAHILFYNRFIKGARAIQYLTSKECEDTRCLFDNDCFIVPNGIFQPDTTKQQFHDDSIKGIYIGRLDIYQKGIDVLLDAVEDNKESLRAQKFTIKVYGPQQNDYETVRRLIDEKGIGDIVLLKGETRGKSKESALLDADVFFLTSRFEGHPMGLIEALAYGLPCFVTPGTNMAEEVVGAGCGWVADFSKESISERLKQMIGDRNSFSIMGKKAQMLSQNYDWNRLAIKFHEELSHLL